MEREEEGKRRGGAGRRGEEERGRGEGNINGDKDGNPIVYL